MDNRIIQALIYLIGGIFLGITLSIVWAMYINSQTSALMIILITSIVSSILGFLFPNSIQHWFKCCWNIFK